MRLEEENVLSIPPGQRCVIVGRTGCGKTTLSRYIMYVSQTRWIIIDRKIDPSLTKGYKVFDKIPTIRQIIKALDVSPGIVVRPSPAAFRSGLVDDFVAEIHEHIEDVGLYVDELLSLHKHGICGDGLTSWLTRGRSRAQSFLGSTQRPSWVSSFIFSEADIFVSMALNREEDRKKIYDFVGDKGILEKLPKRSFFRYVVEDDDLKRFAPVELIEK